MTESRKGELYILVEGILWAFFPIVTTLSYASVSGLASLAWSTLISMFFFAAIVTYRKRWHEMHACLVKTCVKATELFT